MDYLYLYLPSFIKSAAKPVPLLAKLKKLSARVAPPEAITPAILAANVIESPAIVLVTSLQWSALRVQSAPQLNTYAPEHPVLQQTFK